ncbi:fibronectin type III domain-containing protein [Microbacterium esteraromaticum]|uniref:fibronectin type III domain-containing protein n=1 Tax=Microbacterium esteraromaticum TaxID=57043 RepID=UPI002368A6C3|nr:fibronectin type III domain-containing protein [Microbacterium esteraromaticum]WDH77937.1 fibronectin type III domain-containing protein [Microbacterium esteraromaticum]
MATNNGTKKDAYSGRPAFYLRLYVWRSSLDIANNRSRYSWWLRAYNPDRNKLTYRLDNDPYAVNVEGDSWSGGHHLDFRGGQSYIEIASGTTGWKSHSSSGELQVNYSASHGPAGVFGSASLSGSFYTDTIPIPPSGLTVTRVSDTQHTLQWSRHSTYTKVGINRRTDGGSWERVATPSGNLWTFTDTTTSAEHEYEYAVRGIAAAGESAQSNSVTVRTTPKAPSTPTAARTSGDDIRVAVSMGGYGTHLDLQDDGATVVSALPESSLPWDHVAPNPAIPHNYRARARVASGGAGSTTLYSAWSGYSNVIQLISPPNAPVSLSPNGGTAPSDEDVVLSWVHNPVDSSPQSAFEARHRPVGGVWTTISGTTADSVTVALATDHFEWEARTKGAHPDWSPWSATAVFEVIDPPGVAVIQPATIWDASTLPVEWTFFQAQAHPQSSWELELLSEGDVIESRQGDGAATSITLTSRLPEGFYEVRVRAAAGDVLSAWTTVAFEVAFIPPGPPVITGVWDESQGGVVLSVAAEEYGGAVFEGGAWYTEVGV